QMNEMKVKLEKSEDQLQSYANSMNLVFTGDKEKANVSDEKLRQLQAELSNAQAQRVALQAKNELAASGSADALAQVLDDPSLRSNTARLLELRQQLAQLSSTLTPQHYKVQQVQAQIAEVDAQRKKSEALIVQRMQNEFHEAERREKLVKADYDAQAAVVSEQASRTIHYNILQREVETNRQLYESLLQKVKEAGITSALRATNIQVIDPAVPAGIPFAPDLKHGAIAGLMCGLFAGVGLVLLREQMHRRIEGPGDGAFYLKAPELGVIPSRVMDRFDRRKGVGVLNSVFREKREDLAVVTSRRTHSLMAEAFRMMVTSILFQSRNRPLQAIVISSPGPAEGKTTVICNLAQAYAQINRRVLMIDCDMRRPRVHYAFGLPNDEGLTDLLAEKTPLEARSLFPYMLDTGIPGVTIIPAGSSDASSTNLIHSPRMAELIALARQQFDIILMDTPPMLHLSDARLIAALADGVVLVLRSGDTLRESALSARCQLVEDGTPLVGIALNDWNPKHSGYSTYKSYKNYYSSYKQQDQ
ncbi:MAG: polysaccharide biosynthesis tyrosine autokinase, partial [Acidobacteriota bacterium]